MSMAFGASSGSAFGANGFANLGANTATTQAQTGPDLPEILTEAIGFHAYNNEAKVQLISSPWPSDNPPPSTSSLLAIASKKGLLAAAGADSVIVASTESVQQAFRKDGGDIKPFTPQLTLDIPTRISQIAFSSDESMLVLSAEQGGGLAIYSVDDLLQGQKESAFQMPTNGISVRALIPNPSPDHAELFAVVTMEGQLLMANMKEKQFSNGANGQILKEGVSCLSWSNKGAQLVGGLASGAALQMTPDGTVKQEIPTPPGLDPSNQHVSAISWLRDHVFVVAHTPNPDFENGIAALTTYHAVTRDKATSNCVFRKLPAVADPFNIPRAPSQFLQKLRDFPPDLLDVLVVANTASQDIGLFTRSSKPLTNEGDPDSLVNVFTTTSMANDSRRAALPMAEDMSGDTSPVGIALDLSSKATVHRPLPSEEMDESPTPLPGLMVLNNLGVLSAWWIVYADSIRNGTHYPGLAMYAGQQQPPATQQTPAPAPATTSAFGNFGSSNKSAFGQTSIGSSVPAPAFGAPSKPVSAFGSTSTMGATAPTFGSPSALGGGTPAFGAPGLGNRTSPWGTGAQQATSGSAFGQPAFGGTSSLGQKPSPWAGTGGSAFGQTSNLGGTGSTFGSQATQSSPFGSTSTPAGGSGGFAAFAGSGGFASVAAKSSGSSFLKQSTPSKIFGSEMDTGSSFATPKVNQTPSGSAFGLGSSSFQLGSAWKNPQPGLDTEPKTSGQGGSTLFGGDFGQALGDTTTKSSAAQSNEADMDDMNDEEQPQPTPEPQVTEQSPIETHRETTTPADTPAPAKFFSAPPIGTGLFGTQAQKDSAPAAEVQKSTPAPSIFGGPKGTTSGDEPAPIIKKEPVDDDDDSHDTFSIPNEPPLPPDPTSKTSYTPGASSAASSSSASRAPADDAPLPPDFVQSGSRPKAGSKDSIQPPIEEATPLPSEFIKPQPKALPPPQTPTEPLPSFLATKSRITQQEATPGETTALPGDDDNDRLDDEGSGVDVAKEIDNEASPRLTPESSFGGKHDSSPLDHTFAQVHQPQPAAAQKSLFGEIGKNKMPMFPPPSKLQQSPRSPSPVRTSIPPGSLRPDLRSDNARSVSAPGLSASKTLPRSIIQVPPPAQPLENRQAEERARRAREREQQLQEEAQSLSDDEDEYIQQTLSSEIVPTLDLPPFLAHQDSSSSDRPTKDGVPGSIERVYRDINSMLAVLGLNSRNLQAFTKRHAECLKQGGRSRNDILSPAIAGGSTSNSQAAKDEEWSLAEIEDLMTIESELFNNLNQPSLTSLPTKHQECLSLRTDLARLRARQADFKRTIARLTPTSISDSFESVADDAATRTTTAHRLAPLTAEQSLQRQQLRRKFALFQQQLCEAEEKITLLRAQLASHASSSYSPSRPGSSTHDSPSKQKMFRSSPRKVPTVEAVENTIRKMTAMAEKKSGDIDVLEMEMRRLGLGLGFGAAGSSGAGSVELIGRFSRESTPGTSVAQEFVTPPTSTRRNRGGFRSSFIDGGSLSASRTDGDGGGGCGAQFYTPRSTALGASQTSFRSSLGASGMGGFLGPSPSRNGRRRGLSDVDAEEIKAYREREGRKKEVGHVLRSVLRERGRVEVRPLRE